MMKLGMYNKYMKCLSRIPVLLGHFEAPSQFHAIDIQGRAVDRVECRHRSAKLFDIAPLIRDEIWACLQRIKDDGLSILVVDKNIADLIKLADRHYVIEKGKVVWSGTSDELKADETLQERYLGV